MEAKNTYTVTKFFPFNSSSEFQTDNSVHILEASLGRSYDLPEEVAIGTGH